jgi:hypothetical protein
MQMFLSLLIYSLKTVRWEILLVYQRINFLHKDNTRETHKKQQQNKTKMDGMVFSETVLKDWYFHLTSLAHSLDASCYGGEACVAR